jgi:hypothetical protein
VSVRWSSINEIADSEWIMANQFEIRHYSFAIS